MATKTEALANDPSDFKDSNEIVYTELNLEKWSIWEPLSSRRSPRARIIERQRVLEDGSRITAKVEIGFTQYGNLSTRDQKIYYVLFKLWDEAGRPETEVSFSLQKIARFLGEEWGSKECRSITRALLQLRGVLFVWENSYFDKNSGEHIERLDTFNILSELTIARRSRKLHATNEQCAFQFHREILKNLQANHTTPLFLATVLSFKSEIAQILYPRLDLLLADKKQYERRTKELFEELGLEGESYRHRSARKRVLERALEELRGAPLTTGCIVAATVEPTRDNDDFKIVIQKGPRRKVLKAFPPPPVIADEKEPNQPSRSNDPVAIETSLATSEALVVRYFHQKFHGAAPKSDLNPKELASAARLIEAHGLSKTKALIDYAQAEAPKTNYTPASLNGILQYEGRFVAQQTAQERVTNERQERQQQREHAQGAQDARERALLSDLMDRVGETKKSAPQAFTAFLRRVESQRGEFLETPIARRASPSMREMLSHAYEQPAKRLEIFVEFFSAGSDGEVLLSLSTQGQTIARWVASHHGALQALLEKADFSEEDTRLLY